MIRFCANVGFLFTELPFRERFAAARAAGFDAVEFAWPHVAHDDLREAIAAARVRVAQMNMDAGDLAAGERGWASHPDAVGRWRDAFQVALDLAGELDCPRINVLAGNGLPGFGHEDMVRCLLDNLRWALPHAARHRVVLLLEVLNATDTPAYLFNDTASATALLTHVDHPALRLQFDTYHVASGGEQPAARFRELAPLVGHVQVADFPGRHEPGTGTTDFDAFFAALAETGYGGAVGLEYVPSTDTRSSLGWLQRTQRR